MYRPQPTLPLYICVTTSAVWPNKSVDARYRLCTSLCAGLGDPRCVRTSIIHTPRRVGALAIIPTIDMSASTATNENAMVTAQSLESKTGKDSTGKIPWQACEYGRCRRRRIESVKDDRSRVWSAGCCVSGLLTAGDRLICKPGTYFELVPVTINGRQYRIWKNVSLLRHRRQANRPPRQFADGSNTRRTAR